MTEAILWGGTGHSRVLRELMASLGISILAIVDNRAVNAPFPGPAMLLGLDGLKAWMGHYPKPTETLSYALAIGGGYGRDRMAIARELDALGLRHLSLVHPTAIVAPDASLGKGSQVLLGATVATHARIGACSIVNTRASVDHDCIVGDGVHIGPGATLCGQIEIGHGCFVGAGATILPHLKIGDDAVIGAGAVVTKNIAPGETVVGTPAKLHCGP
ncbi:carbonic anhydrase [Labrys miyagiensis]